MCTLLRIQLPAEVTGYPTHIAQRTSGRSPLYSNRSMHTVTSAFSLVDSYGVGVVLGSCGCWLGGEPANVACLVQLYRGACGFFLLA